MSVFHRQPDSGNAFDELDRCARALSAIAYDQQPDDIALTQDDCTALVDVMHEAYWASTVGFAPQGGEQ